MYLFLLTTILCLSLNLGIMWSRVYAQQPAAHIYEHAPIEPSIHSSICRHTSAHTYSRTKHLYYTCQNLKLMGTNGFRSEGNMIGIRRSAC